MPPQDGTGIEAADRAYAMSVRAVIVTGYALSFPKEQLGRFEFPLKPVRSAELLGAIRRVLDAPVPQ
jgi:hypothetical protein